MSVVNKMWLGVRIRGLSDCDPGCAARGTGLGGSTWRLAWDPALDERSSAWTSWGAAVFASSGLGLGSGLEI